MKYKQIPKMNLIKGRWYIGRGRNSNIGFWTGKDFITLGIVYNSWDIKGEPYYSRKGGAFQPFLLIDEGKIVPFGKIGWKKHYGKELIIDEKTIKSKKRSFTSRDKHQLDIEQLSLSSEINLRFLPGAKLMETVAEDCLEGDGPCNQEKCDNPSCLRKVK